MKREPYTLTWIKPATLQVGLSDGGVAWVTLQQMALLRMLAEREISPTERLVADIYRGVRESAVPSNREGNIRTQFSKIRTKLNIRVNYTADAGYWLDEPRPEIRTSALDKPNARL